MNTDLFSPRWILLSSLLLCSCSATLRKIDLTGNLITEIQDGAFLKLPNLEELNLAENGLSRLPMLPAKLHSFDASNNRLKSQGVKATAFKVSYVLVLN